MDSITNDDWTEEQKKYRNELEEFVKHHPWVEEPMFRSVSPYGCVSKTVLMYGEREEDDDTVQCLQQLTLKQRVYLQGVIRKKLNFLASQAYCDKETQLASIALQAFRREDYTMGVIYRYVDEEHISEALVL